LGRGLNRLNISGGSGSGESGSFVTIIKVLNTLKTKTLH
jgi:hypothetical protein